MFVPIRFFCASLLVFQCSLFGAEDLPLIQFTDQEVEFEILSTMTSSWEIKGSPIEVATTESMRGKLGLDGDDLDDSIPMHFTLEELTWKVELGGVEKKIESIEELELLRWRNKPLPFLITKSSPYLEFSSDFKRQYGDLALFKTPFFAGLLPAQDLATLFEMKRRQLKVGEGFELLLEKSDKVPYIQKQTFVLREITADRVIVEVTTLIDRQKIPFAEGRFAVIFGEFKAVWTIHRKDALLFHLEESGILTHGMKLGDLEVMQTHRLEKQITTYTQVDSKFGFGQRESSRD